jgi:hypothetical protein
MLVQQVVKKVLDRMDEFTTNYRRLTSGNSPEIPQAGGSVDSQGGGDARVTPKAFWPSNAVPSSDSLAGSNLTRHNVFLGLLHAQDPEGVAPMLEDDVVYHNFNGSQIRGKKAVLASKPWAQNISRMDHVVSKETLDERMTRIRYQIHMLAVNKMLVYHTVSWSPGGKVREFATPGQISRTCSCRW